MCIECIDRDMRKIQAAFVDIVTSEAGAPQHQDCIPYNIVTWRFNDLDLTEHSDPYYMDLLAESIVNDDDRKVIAKE